MPDPKPPPTSIVERLREDCHNPFSGRCLILGEAADKIAELQQEIDRLRGRELRAVDLCDHADLLPGPWVQGRNTVLCYRCPAWRLLGEDGWRTTPRPEQNGRVLAPVAAGWRRPVKAPPALASALWGLPGLRAWDYHCGELGEVHVFADARARPQDVGEALRDCLSVGFLTKGEQEVVVVDDQDIPHAYRFTQLHEPWTFRHQAKGAIEPIRPPEITRPFNFEEARALLQASASSPLAVPIAEMAAGYRRIWRAEEERIVRETPPGHFAVIGAPALHPGGGWGGSEAVERWVMRMAYLPAEKMPDMPAGLEPGITWHIYAVNDGAGIWAEGVAP